MVVKPSQESLGAVLPQEATWRIANMDFEIESLKEQLDRIDRSNRRIKFGGIFILACVVVVILLGAAKQTASRTVEATEFVMRDSQGNIRAHLYSDKDGAHFVLLNPSGGQSVFLETSKDGSHFVVLNPSGPPSVFLETSGDSASLSLSGAKDHDVVLSTGKDISFLTIEQGPSAPNLNVNVGADVALLSLRGKSVKDTIDVSVGSDGPIVELGDKQGFQAALGTTSTQSTRTGTSHKTSAASLVMFGADAKVLWSAP